MAPRFRDSAGNFIRPGPGVGLVNRNGVAMPFVLPQASLPVAAALGPFEVRQKDATTVFVGVSTLLGDIPTEQHVGNDPVLELAVGNGFVWARAEIDPETGAVTERHVESGPTVPAEDIEGGSYFWELAEITILEHGGMDISQGRMGPIEFHMANLPGADTERGITLVDSEGDEGRGGHAMRSLRGENGATVRVDPANAGRILIGGGAVREFTVTQVPAESTVWVAAGTVLGMLPTHMYVHDDPRLTLAVADGNNVYIRMVFEDDGTLSECFVEKASDVPDDDPSSQTYFIPLCQVTVVEDDHGNAVITTDQERYGPIEYYALNLPIDPVADRGVSIFQVASGEGGIQGQGASGFRTFKAEGGATVRVDPDNAGRILIGGGMKFPLQCVDVSVIGSVLMQCRYGRVAGRIADVGMHTGDSIPFLVDIGALASGSVYVQVPAKFNDKGFWVPDTVPDNEVLAADTVPEKTVDNAFVELCTFTVTAGDDTHPPVIAIAQTYLGSLSWRRYGDDTDYDDDFNGSRPVPD